jgi:hypothetical protein
MVLSFRSRVVLVPLAFMWCAVLAFERGSNFTRATWVIRRRSLAFWSAFKPTRSITWRACPS